MTETDQLPTRMARLEAWVETVMRQLACLGLEDVLTELDGPQRLWCPPLCASDSGPDQ
jgi:hypothetical protein